jgi:hypothetical protein
MLITTICTLCDTGASTQDVPTENRKNKESDLRYKNHPTRMVHADITPGNLLNRFRMKGRCLSELEERSSENILIKCPP